MLGAGGPTWCSCARAVSAARSRCRGRGLTGVSSRWHAAVGRGAGRARHACSFLAWSLTGVPAHGILLCDECTQEPSAGPVHPPAAGPPPRGGGPAWRRGAGAGRDADRAGAPVRQARLPVRARRAARPVCLLRPAPGRRGRAPVVPAALAVIRRCCSAASWPRRCWRRSRRSTLSCWPAESSGSRWAASWLVPRGRRRWRRWPTWLSRCWEAWVNGEHKITSSHRDRAALVYPRRPLWPSSASTQWTRSQYALADKAAALGWPRTRSR